MNNCNESDWKLFRKKLPEWQEAYMERLVREYTALLAGPEKASDKFWKLEKRINSDRNHVGVVATMSRSWMIRNIYSLLAEGAITPDDLTEFSDDLQGQTAHLIRNGSTDILS